MYMFLRLTTCYWITHKGSYHWQRWILPLSAIVNHPQLFIYAWCLTRFSPFSLGCQLLREWFKMEFLTGLVLFKFCAGDHNFCKLLLTTAISSPETRILSYFSPSFDSYNLFTSSFMMSSKSWGWVDPFKSHLWHCVWIVISPIDSCGPYGVTLLGGMTMLK